MMEFINRNGVRHPPLISRKKREQRHGHQSTALWFTGLSGAGKSTLAYALEAALYSRNRNTFVLDGDNVRQGLCSDLGFSAIDRAENIRRVAQVARLFLDAGVIVLAAFISPFRRDREKVKALLGDDYLEIYVQCPLERCEQRDTKGLYAQARAGQIHEFTGISSPYEAPEAPDLMLNTQDISIEEGIRQLLNFLICKGVIVD